jgi:hypothetical protein
VSGCDWSGLRAGLAVGGIDVVVDLVRQIRGSPVITDGLASFRVVGSDRVAALLLDALDDRQLVADLLVVALAFDSSLGTRRRLELVQEALGIVDLGVELLDVGVCRLEVRLGCDAVVSRVLPDDRVATTPGIARQDGEPPHSDTDGADEEGQSDNPECDGAERSTLHLAEVIAVVPLLFLGHCFAFRLVSLYLSGRYVDWQVCLMCRVRDALLLTHPPLDTPARIDRLLYMPLQPEIWVYTENGYGDSISSFA